MVGQVGEAILKYALTPLKTLLGALSHLPGVGKYAKAGLDLLNKGLEGVSDFADKAAAKGKKNFLMDQINLTSQLKSNSQKYLMQILVTKQQAVEKVRV